MPRGKRSSTRALGVDAEQVEIAGQAQVLEAVVQHMDARAELGLHGSAHHVTPPPHRHDHPRKLPREHDRFVAGLAGGG